jgi:hypothetical protein
VLGLPPAFNLSHDQTLQFKIIDPLSGSNLAQGFKRIFEIRNKSNLYESLALIVCDFVTSHPASAHMNVPDASFLKSVDSFNLSSESVGRILQSFTPVSSVYFSNSSQKPLKNNPLHLLPKPLIAPRFRGRPDKSCVL